MAYKAPIKKLMRRNTFNLADAASKLASPAPKEYATHTLRHVKEETTALAKDNLSSGVYRVQRAETSSFLKNRAAPKVTPYYPSSKVTHNTFVSPEVQAIIDSRP